jgi:hypothetical protein
MPFECPGYMSQTRQTNQDEAVINSIKDFSLDTPAAKAVAPKIKN